MKRYHYQGNIIQAFQFAGTMDMQLYAKDNLPPEWFAEAFVKKEFVPLPQQVSYLQHLERSMHVQRCYAGDYVAIDEHRPDIGVFFIRQVDFQQYASPYGGVSPIQVDKTEAFSTLRDANIARQKEWDAGGELSLSFKGNELAGETGELCNVIKKLEREALGLPGSRDTVEHAAEEMADVIICVDLLATHLGVDLWQAVANKFNATSEKNGLKTRLVIPNGDN